MRKSHLKDRRTEEAGLVTLLLLTLVSFWNFGMWGVRYLLEHLGKSNVGAPWPF